MDNHEKKKNGACWTNERHLRFLNSIEASFVRTMFENNQRPLRLDRQLPDCYESTQDLENKRRRHSTTDVTEYSSARTDKNNKRIYSHDQVVPQIENRIDDDIKDEKEKDHAKRST